MPTTGETEPTNDWMKFTTVERTGVVIAEKRPPKDDTKGEKKLPPNGCDGEEYESAKVVCARGTDGA